MLIRLQNLLPGGLCALLFTIYFICCSQKSFSQEVVEINSERFEITFDSPEKLWYFEDTTAQLSIAEVWQADSLFDQGASGSGVFFARYWVKVALQNNTPYDIEVVATEPRTIDSWVYKKEEDGFFKARFGSFTKKRDINPGDTRTHVSLKLKAGKVEYLYFQGEQREFTASFTDALTFNEAEKRGQWLDALFYGASIIFIFYSIIQFAVYRKRMFFYLTIFAFGYGMYAFAVRGDFVDFLMPNLPKEGLNFSMAWLQIGHLGSLLLTINFLELRSKFPRWHKVFLGLIGLALFKLVFGLYLTIFLEDYVTMTNMSMVTLMIDIITFKVLFFSLWKKVNTSRKVFLVGLVLFGLVLITGIIVWQFFPFGNFRQLLVLIASTASLSQVIVFSIALGIQMRQFEVDKNRALDDLNVVLKEQNKKIEQEVVDRTAEINAQNIQLEERNDRIETLFREVHHRVKNNLQLISSLLNMQQEWSSTEDPAKAIEDSRSRVVAMSMIHQFLYRTDDISTIDFKQYAEELANRLDEIQVERVGYELNLEFDDAYVFDIDTSISLGLILNELITNSYKYALADKRELKIGLYLKKEGDDMYQMMYSDNGPEIKVPFQQLVKKGFGLRLASRLSRQLQGTFAYEFENENRFIITFAGQELRLAMADG